MSSLACVLCSASAAHTRHGEEQSCKLGMHPAAASVAAGRGGQNVSASTDAPPLPTLDVRSHPRTRHGPTFGLRPRAEDPSADARPTSSRAEQAGGGSAAAPAGSFTSVTIHPRSTPSSGQPPGSQTAHVPEISAMFDVGEPRRYYKQGASESRPCWERRHRSYYRLRRKCLA